MFNENALFITADLSELLNSATDTTRSSAQVLRVLQRNLTKEVLYRQRLMELWRDSDKEFLWGDSASLFLRFNVDFYLTVYLVIPEELGGSGEPLTYWKLKEYGTLPDTTVYPPEEETLIRTLPDNDNWIESFMAEIHIAIEATHVEAIAEARKNCRAA